MAVVVCVIAAAGCSSSSGSGSEDESADSDRATPTTEPDTGAGASPDESDRSVPPAQPDDRGGVDDVPEPSITDEELTERLAELGGRLAVGSGPEVAVVRPDGARIETLDGSESVVAAQPTWSHDGQQLAWSSISAERQVVQIQRFDEEGERAGDPVSTDATGNTVFYLQWNQTDERLAYIRNAPGGGFVEVGVVEPGRPARPVGQGAPFFISWSPTPDRLLGHVNESSIDAYVQETAADGFSTVRSVAGGFSAPAWVDERRALIVDGGRLSYLDVESGEVEAIIDVGGPVRFVLSPDRTKVAFQLRGDGGGPSLIAARVGRVGRGDDELRAVQADQDGLIVLDLATGDEELVTSDLAVAWEWSPDSGSVAWLQAQVSGGRPIGRWNFWPSGSGSGLVMERSAEFLLTRKYGQAYLPFFAQYAQSVTGWSPDSSAFAFAGSVGGQRGVWIQLLSETVAPRLVAPGDFVTWGPGTPPPPDGRPSAA